MVMTVKDPRKENPRKYYTKRKGSMEKEFASFKSHYKELSDYIQPRRGRFFMQDRNKGTKRHNNIVNNTATKALRTATSGMLDGTMSPTRPWFSLETHNPDLMESQDVKIWMAKVERLIRTVLNDSNFYSQSSTMLSELLLFGTGCMSHVDDFEDVARFYAHTAGSYFVGQNDRFEVDTLVRHFEMQAIQMATQFGFENLSDPVKQCINRGDYDKWFPVIHFIEPNRNAKADSSLAVNMPFISVYFEPHNNESDKRMLQVSGFEEFPAYCPRWDVTGEDVYGTDCPGMTSLGDVKALQIQEKRKAQAIDKMVNPPLTGPASIRNVPVDALPGGLTIYDSGPGGTQKLDTLYTVDPRLNELRSDMEAIEQRINESFFVDLFLAISQMEGIQPRNQLDLMQRNEERLLQLGPVLQHLHGEFLSKVVDRIFNQLVRADVLPEAPSELQGKDIKVKFISTLAMAQRAVATQSIDRLAAFAGNLAAIWGGAAEKFNAEQAIDEYAQAIGASPSLVVPDDVLAEQRQAQQQQAQMAQALEAGQMAANIAQTASNAKTDEDNLLTETMEST